MDITTYRLDRQISEASSNIEDATKARDKAVERVVAAMTAKASGIVGTDEVMAYVGCLVDAQERVDYWHHSYGVLSALRGEIAYDQKVA